MEALLFALDVEPIDMASSDWWVKIRIGLADEPEVIQMASALGLDTDVIVGKLTRFWGWIKRVSEDGTAPVQAAWIDQYLDCPGFAAALAAVEWLFIMETGISVPRFEKHLSSAASKRLDGNERVRKHRALKRGGNANVTGDDDKVKRSVVTIPRPLHRHILERDGFTCVYCGWHCPPAKMPKQPDEVLSVDHIMPSSRGGMTVAPNLVTACVRCNNMKNDRTPEEAGLTLGHLTTAARNEIVTPDRYSSVTKPLPEKRREENKDLGVCAHPPRGEGGAGEEGWCNAKSVTRPLHDSSRNGRAQDALNRPFDRFWHAYGKPVAKLAAAKVWDELNVDEALLAEILAAIEKQKQSDLWRKGKQPDAHNWLRGQRWNDELPASGSGNAQDSLQDAIARKMRTGCQKSNTSPGPPNTPPSSAS